MGGKIDCYIDCDPDKFRTVQKYGTNAKACNISVSPYSYFAVLHLRRNREALKAYNIDIEFHPIFLGGVNQGSGNKPPWMLPAKGKYLKFDRERAMEYFNTPDMKTPEVFPIVSLLPQRAQTYVKHTYPDKLEPVFLTLWHYLWESNRDVSKPEILSSVLAEHFSESQVEEILKAAQAAEWKQALNDKTKEALDRGAFGAPWFWVRSERGGKVREEPFFGSDRFTVMWQYLGLDWKDVEILKPGEGSQAKL